MKTISTATARIPSSEGMVKAPWTLFVGPAGILLLIVGLGDDAIAFLPTSRIARVIRSAKL
jgi:hypothetical protein